MAVSANRLELLQIANSVAEEKVIDREVVIAALEDAVERAAHSRYGQETEIKADIDTKTGEISLNRILNIVETVENPAKEITLEEAKSRDPEAEIDGVITEPLPPMDFGRIAAQSAKQVIVQKVREAERDRQYEEFKDREFDIVHGIVKRIEYGNIIVDLGQAESILRRDQLIPRETFQNGDRIRALITKVSREGRGPQIFLSRTDPEFMARLFASEVPEIYDGIIEIKSVARDPGSRAKIAVSTTDTSIDPVGACVGMRGSRVQAVVGELQNEKIDIIPWSPDPVEFICSALQPAAVSKVFLDDDEDSQQIEIVVPEDQLSLAIGRRGQNVRLASELTNWKIDILSEAQESERQQKEFAERTPLFMETLNVDEMVAQLLATEGFATVDEIAYTETSEISGIEGFDEDTAIEIQERAREYLEELEEKNEKEIKKLGVKKELRKVDGLSTQLLVILGQNNIRTIEDFAGCATDELVGWNERVDGEMKKFDGMFKDQGVPRRDAENMILHARILAGWIDASEFEVEEEEDAEQEEEAVMEDEDSDQDEEETSDENSVDDPEDSENSDDTDDTEDSDEIAEAEESDKDSV